MVATQRVYPDALQRKFPISIYAKAVYRRRGVLDLESASKRGYSRHHLPFSEL